MSKQDKKFIIALIGMVFVPYIVIGYVLYKQTRSKLMGFVAGLVALLMYLVLFNRFFVNTYSIETLKHDNVEIIQTTFQKLKTPEVEVIDKTKEAEIKETLSQKQAVRQAESYINTMAFSKKGLIDQLKYEGYSQKDAEYAVNKLKINYNNQAFKQAESYLDTMAFSRKGLIDQLKYDGFTEKQSIYAVDKIGL